MLALPNILSTVDALIAETDDLLNYSAYTLSNNTTPSYDSFNSYSTPIFSSYSTPIFNSQNIISNDYYPFEQDDSGVSMALNSAWNTLDETSYYVSQGCTTTYTPSREYLQQRYQNTLEEQEYYKQQYWDNKAEGMNYC